MTDQYNMDLHDRTLEEQDVATVNNFIERNVQSRTSGSSQQTTIGDDQQSADEPEPTPDQLAEENQSDNNTTSTRSLDAVQWTSSELRHFAESDGPTRWLNNYVYNSCSHSPFSQYGHERDWDTNSGYYSTTYSRTLV